MIYLLIAAAFVTTPAFAQYNGSSQCYGSQCYGHDNDGNSWNSQTFGDRDSNQTYYHDNRGGNCNQQCYGGTCYTHCY